MDNLAPSQKFDFYAHGVASGQKDLWTPFLGPPARDPPQRAASNRNVAKWNMPEAYVGDNLYLRDTMEDYMFTAEQTWYTERILPWYRTDQISVQWDEWENNPHYMGITPHQATSRVVTQKRTTRKASMIRRGIAAEFEHDFVATPLGRTSFLASLAQMARSVQETANVEVLRALLHCHTYQMVHLRKYGIIPDGDLDSWLERRAERFMIAQKDTYGLEKMNTWIDTEQEAYGGKANVWILGREIMDYCSLVPEGKIFYWLGGQEAIDRVNGRPQNGTAAAGTMGNVRSLQPQRMIQDTPVFIAKSKAVAGIGMAELLSRVTEVGIFNTMFDRTRDYTRYKTAGRNIRVYNAESDDWEVLEFVHMIRNLPIWDTNGDLYDVFGAPGARGGRGGAGSAADAIDADYDFLSYKSGERRVNVSRVGDISVHHLTALNLLDAGQTVVNALVHGDAKEARKIVLKLDEVVGRARNTNGLVYTPPAGEDETFLRNLTENLFNILGSSNLLFEGLNTSAARYNRFLEMFVQFGLGAAENNRILAQVGADVETIQRKALDEKKFIVESIGKALGPSYADQVVSIADDGSKSWRQRAEQIRELMHGALRSGQLAASTIDEPGKIDRFINKRTGDFEEEMQNKYPNLSDEASAQIEREVKYFPVGARLPQGWRWISKESERPATLLSSFMNVGALEQKQAAPRIGAGLSRAPGNQRAFDQAAYNQQDAAARNNQRVGYAGIQGNMMTHLENISKTPGPALLVKWAAAAYAMTKFNRDVFVGYAISNVYVPFGAILFRSHSTWKTRFGIKCADGGQTGYTFIGHSNMQVEHEAARKVGFMHYTTYLSSVVFAPKNVFVVEDLFCEKVSQLLPFAFFFTTALFF